MSITFSLTAGSGTTNVQDSYAMQHQIAQRGLVGDYQPYVARTGLNKSGSTIPFARLIAKDTSGGADPQAVKEFGAANDILLGISMLTETMEKITTATTPGFTYSSTGGYPDGYVVNVMSQGVIYVPIKASTTIAIGDAVHYYFTGDNKGVFSSSGTASESVTLTQVRFLDPLASTSPTNNTARLVRLEILHPGIGVVADA